MELWGRTEVASATTSEGTCIPWTPGNVRICQDPDSVLLNSQNGRKSGMQWPTLSWNTSCCGIRSLQFPCHVPSWGSRSPLICSKIPKFLFQRVQNPKFWNSSCRGVQTKSKNSTSGGKQISKFRLQGVRIPTLGALHVVPWQGQVGDMEVTTRRPIFCLARNLVQSHNLMDDWEFCPGRTMGILRWTWMEGEG